MRCESPLTMRALKIAGKGTDPNAFLRSSHAISIVFLYFLAWAMLLWRTKLCSRQPSNGRNPFWVFDRMPSFEIHSSSLPVVADVNSLPIVLMRAIGRQFEDSDSSPPLCSNVVTDCLKWVGM